MKRRLARKVWSRVLLALALTSCGDRLTEDYGAREYQISTAIARPSEEPLLQLASQFEPFAGYYCEEGDLIVAVATTVDEDVRAVVQGLIGDSVASGCRTRDKPGYAPAVLVRQVKYNFLSLRTWRDSVVDDFFALPGAISLGISYRDNRLTMSVESAAGFQGVEGLLQSKAVPADARVIAEGQRAQTQACANPSNGPTVRGCFRPIPAGVQVSTTLNGGDRWCEPPPGACACTVGSANIRWMAELATPRWQQGYVTASHCVPDMAVNQSDWLFQNVDPPVDPGNFVAFEWLDPAAFSCGGTTCRYSDAAWAWSYGNEAERGTIAKTLWWNGSLTIDSTSPRFYIWSIRAPIEGMTVDKVGRTTGWTYGTIPSGGVCNDEIAAFGPRMVCQTRATYSSDAGDSGSPVFFWWDDEYVDMVGIHWGATIGYRVFSPWANVVLELGDVDTTIW